jgi:hypothetical protein
MLITGIFLTFTTNGFCQVKTFPVESVEKYGQSTINWSVGYIEAMGLGASPDSATAKIQNRPIALRAAKEMASRNLAEIVRMVQVDSSAKLVNLMAQNSALNTQVNALIQSAIVADQQFMPDGTVEIKLRIALNRELGQAIFPLLVAPKQEAIPPATPATSGAATFTGIVVDARGTGARPAIFPRILDEGGKEIYAASMVDSDAFAQFGMSGYTREIMIGPRHPRVAPSALVIKAIRASGEAKADVVISKEDAQKINIAPQSAGLLKQCRVMIVVD